MKKFVFLLITTILLLSSSCSKEIGLITFDITVKNKDNSAVTEGNIQIHASKIQFTGDVTVFLVQIPVENGKAHFERPFDPEIDNISLRYLRPGISLFYTIVGCNDEFDPYSCDMSKAQRDFVIDITIN